MFYNLNMERDIELNYQQSETDLDIRVANGDLKLGSGLANRILISLFTWAAPEDGDEIPVGVKNGGYWGDDVVSRDSETPGTFGSRIWEINGKITDETLANVESYARESLNWISDESSVSEFDVVVTRPNISQIDLTVTLNMANGEMQKLVYADVLNWGK